MDPWLTQVLAHHFQSHSLTLIVSRPIKSGIKWQMRLKHAFATKRAMMLIRHFMFNPNLNVNVRVPADEQILNLKGIFGVYICRKIYIVGLRATHMFISSLPLTFQYTHLSTSNKTPFRRLR